MKTLTKLTVMLAILIIAGAASMKPASAGVSFDFFYSNLSPHGSWVVSGSYGHVWQPSVYHAGWNPYYDGHWMYTSAGWAWDSDYAWGAIPYHYGTWVTDPAYGWVWVPGYTYAPSWVTFREGPDYIGWAPVAPSFSIGVSFHAGFPLPSSFVFVHSHDFLCDHVRSYAVPHYQTNVIVNNTRIINNNIRIENNVVVNRGPDVRYVERATRRRIDAVPIERTRSFRDLGSRGVSGSDLRVVDRGERGGRALRAAQPEPASRPLPSVRNGGERANGFDRGSPDGDPVRGRDQVRGAERARPGSAGPDDRFDGRDTADRPRASERRSLREDSRRGQERPDVGSLDRGRPGRGGEPRTMQPSPEDRNGRERPDVGSFDRGRPARGGEPRTMRPSSEDRNGRDRAQTPDRSADAFRAPSRADRERSPRPDEGRVFRGVRERQPSPQAQRSQPDRDRATDRSRGSAPKERTRESARGRRSSDRQNDRPRSHKEHDRN